MSASEGPSTSGTAAKLHSPGGEADARLLTPPKKRMKPAGDSPHETPKFWADAAGLGAANEDGDGYETVSAKPKKAKAAVSLNSLRKDRRLPSTPKKPAKASGSRKAKVQGQSTEAKRCALNAPEADSDDSSVSTDMTEAPVARATVSRSVDDRLFVEFICLPLCKVNAVAVRAELNQQFGPLSADLPTPAATSVRVHLGGPEKETNKARLLACTKICTYQIKVSEPREIVRQRGKYVQRVIKGVPHDLSDSDIFEAAKYNECLPLIRAQRIFKIVNTVKVATMAVLMDFTPGTIVPTKMNIGFLKFKLHVYVPPPTRCFVCFGLNHVAKFCRQSQRCSTCAGPHKHTECNQKQQPKCAACGGPHPAMSGSCPKYNLARTATTISVRDGRSYSDALRIAKNQEREKASAAAATTSTAPSMTPTTTVTPAAAPSNPAAARAEPKEQRPPRASRRQRSQVRPPTATAPVVPNGQQEMVAPTAGGRTQREAALEALSGAFALLLGTTEDGGAGKFSPATLIELLVSTIAAAFRIPMDSASKAVTTAYAVVREASGAESSTTSATTPDDRHHGASTSTVERL